MTDVEVVVITPPVAESDMDLDLVNLTEFIWRQHHAGEWYGFGLGGEFGYGVEFANNTFSMFPFYWGDCTCGFDELHATVDRPHAADCFENRYRAEEQRIEKLVPYAERHDLMTIWAKANGYARAPFGMAVHCTCGTHEWWVEWSKEHDHTPDCPLVRPNFAHPASGLEVRWYKWIGRDTETNRTVSPDEWRRIFAECVASVAPTPEGDPA